MRAENHAILIVDDDPDSLDTLEAFVSRKEPGWAIETAINDTEAMVRVRQRVGDGKPFSVIITDIKIGADLTAGLRLIGSVQSVDPLAMTILYTAHRQILDSYDDSGLGAFDIETRATGSSVGESAERIVARTRAAIRYREWAVRNNFLRRYFDARVLQEFEEDPALLEPRLRQVSIVFWDIRGFSTLCDQLREHPKLIAEFLREYCELAAKTIFERQGVLDKFIGDGVMALFGVLDQSDNGQTAAAVSAARAAVCLLEGFNTLIKAKAPTWTLWTTLEITTPSLACGIHTGSAIIGSLGTQIRDQFTALGADVNFAQRLESIAGRDSVPEILISQRTMGRIQGRIPVAEHGVISNVKSMPGSHKIYSIDFAKIPNEMRCQ